MQTPKKKQASRSLRAAKPSPALKQTAAGAIEPGTLRRQQDILLLKNPVYFGIQDKDNSLYEKFKPELQLLSNTAYEELTCISYKPSEQRLSAIVKIKQGNGYKGDACSAGSKEFVRFYVSYDNGASWEDEGFTYFEIHDFGFEEDLCYEVFRTFVPKKKRCCDDEPVLPLVRGILSWDRVPEAGRPNWMPIWGNVLEARIQAAPYRGFICYLKDIFTEVDIKLNPKQYAVLDQSLSAVKFSPLAPQSASLEVLRKVYGKEVEPSRLGYGMATQLLAQKALVPTAQYELFKKIYDLDLSSIIGELLVQQFNTTYEEVKCVGLNRDADTLNASIQIKRSYGYSGNLCSNGSKEFVAYYMNFGSGWQYMGTSHVMVHDITVPAGGLWYNAPLHVTLNPYQKAWCETGKARVRAILSWAVEPPVDPDWVAPWGDREECHVEIKPLPAGVIPGIVTPRIELLGGISINYINNATGLATGPHLWGGFPTNGSSFGGNTVIAGRLLNHNGHSFKYRIRVISPSASEHSLMSNVHVEVADAGGITPYDLIPDANGWLEYKADASHFIISEILGWCSPSENGLHYVKVQFWDTSIAGPVYYNSDWVTFFADVHAPDISVAITSGAGDCGTFHPGDTILGSYSVNDTNCRVMSLQITPAADGDNILIDGVDTDGLWNDSVGPLHLPDGGKSGTWAWQTDATETRPCGYNIWLHAWDRTIVHSVQNGYHVNQPKGFCLLEP